MQIWTWQEERYLQAHYPCTPTQDLTGPLGKTVSAIHQKATKIGLRKSQAFLRSPLSGRIDPSRADGGGRFAKGSVPWNKGTHFDPGGRTAQTRFKPGQLPRNHCPVGTVRPTKGGYLQVKTAEPKRWQLLHRKIWEDAHGTIPPKHVLLFRDGDRQNCALDNLELTDQGEHALCNRWPGWKDLPEDLKAVLRLQSQLKLTIRQKNRHEEQNPRPARPPVHGPGSVE